MGRFPPPDLIHQGHMPFMPHGWTHLLGYQYLSILSIVFFILIALQTDPIVMFFSFSHLYQDFFSLTKRTDFRYLVQKMDFISIQFYLYAKKEAIKERTTSFTILFLLFCMKKMTKTSIDLH